LVMMEKNVGRQLENLFEAFLHNPFRKLPRALALTISCLYVDVSRNTEVSRAFLRYKCQTALRFKCYSHGFASHKTLVCLRNTNPSHHTQHTQPGLSYQHCLVFQQLPLHFSIIVLISQ
jgi:hypothetical protein